MEDEDTSWREYCEDGSDFFVYPEDYDTEEEYEDALEEAMEEAETTDLLGGEWVMTLEFSEDDSTLDTEEEIKAEDFPNKRRFNAAYALANTIPYYDQESVREERARYEFILDYADKIVAANYLSDRGAFFTHKQ